MLWAVIMAGGSGERFWPKSRKHLPKQLLPITSNSETMIQLTLDRLSGYIPMERVFIITNEIQKETMVKQLPFLNPDQIIAEPVGRDTAPCIGLASILIQSKDPKAISLVLPADHVIHDQDSFWKAMNESINLVEKNNVLMTFGIQPTYPAIGYGYIEIDEQIPSSSNTHFYQVKCFREKPDSETASNYIQSGKHYWNSGMFLWKTQTILEEIQKYMPELHQGLLQIQAFMNKHDFFCQLQNIFPAFIKKSIDYGVMERSSKVMTAIGNFDWDDVGSWEAIEKHFTSDENGNVCIGNVRLLGCKRTLVYNLCPDQSLMASAIDLTDQIVVQTPDAVLVCPKKSAQKVKHLVEEFKKSEMERYL